MDLDAQLYVVATPLGNLGDLTPRAREVLAAARAIACEDTRRTWQLLSALGIPRPELFSYRQGNEEGVSRRIVGLPWTVLPGPCSVELALLLSGLPTSSYTFKGFPPRKPGALRRWFEEEAAARHTLVGLESPFRIGATLRAAREALGDREAAVCLEMTKAHERVERGTLAALAERFAGPPPKGELTFVIAGANPKFDHSKEGGTDA